MTQRPTPEKLEYIRNTCHTSMSMIEHELLAEIDALEAALKFRNDTQVTGYCICCEDLQKEHDRLKERVKKLRTAMIDTNHELDESDYRCFTLSKALAIDDEMEMEKK